MITAQDLRGCHVALITPMIHCSGRSVIDHGHLFRLIDNCIHAGVTGVLLAGTTGQSATLSHDEQVDLAARGAERARASAEAVGRAVCVMASAGSNATPEALSLTRRITEAAQPDALLHVTGYYNNPPQEGLRTHFRAVANLAGELGTGVILYNIPGRTGSRLGVDATLELAAHPAIIGIKEASGDLEAIDRLVSGTDPDQFAVLSGEDHLVAEIIRRGGVGVISATANRWPSEFQALCDLALAGRHVEAEMLQSALMPCIRATFAVKNPIPLASMFETVVRLPLVSVDELDEPQRTQVRESIRRALAIESFPHVDLVRGNTR
jgi:4-hydroxy-tetrahydrodipicolinate synthase